MPAAVAKADFDFFTGAPRRNSPAWLLWGTSGDGAKACQSIFEPMEREWNDVAEGGTWKDLHLSRFRAVWKEQFPKQDAEMVKFYTDLANTPPPPRSAAARSIRESF